MEKLTDSNPDVVFLTETWLTSEKNNITAEVKDHGYKLWHKIRKNREKERGGGVGALIKCTITCKQEISQDFHSFEHSVVKFPLVDKRSMMLITVYRLQFVPIAEFFDEFEELLAKYTVMNEDFIIAGDVNVHTETDDCSSRKFKGLLDQFDLIQHVQEPTHLKGHTIDVVISPNKKAYVHDLKVRSNDLGHHHLIEFDVQVSTDYNTTKTITYRTYTSIWLTNLTS